MEDMMRSLTTTLKPSEPKQQSKPLPQTLIGRLARWRRELWRDGSPESLAELRSVNERLHDLLKARGGEWEDHEGAVLILTPDADQMAAAGAKWAAIARFEPGAGHRKRNANLLADYRAALAGKVVAS
jgi:hypothetical protein